MHCGVEDMAPKWINGRLWGMELRAAFHQVSLRENPGSAADRNRVKSP
jgi:hypothetical protein